MPKPKLIVICALGAIQEPYTTGLQKILSNSVRLDKNTLSDALLDGKNHTTETYQTVKKNMYAALHQLAVDQLRDGHDVILHSYHGDKLTQSGTVEYMIPESKDYDTYIIYLHCSGVRQQQLFSERNDTRDDDKRGAKYEPYRLDHIGRHLRELAQVSNVLLVDVEKHDNLEANLTKILQYVQSPAPTLTIIPLSDDAQQQLKDLTVEQALGGFDTFKQLLRNIKGIEAEADIKSDKEMLALYDSRLKVITKAEIEVLLNNEPVCLEDIVIARRLAEANNMDPEAMVNAVKYKFLCDKENFIDEALTSDHNFQFLYPDGFGDGYVDITDSQGNLLAEKIILPEYLTQSLLQVLKPGAQLDYATVLNLYNQHKHDILLASAHDNLNDTHELFEMLVGHIQQGFNDQQILYIYKEYEQLVSELLSLATVILSMANNTLNQNVGNSSVKPPKMRR